MTNTPVQEKVLEDLRVLLLLEESHKVGARKAQVKAAAIRRTPIPHEDKEAVQARLDKLHHLDEQVQAYKQMEFYVHCHVNGLQSIQNVVHKMEGFVPEQYKYLVVEVAN